MSSIDPYTKRLERIETLPRPLTWEQEGTLQYLYACIRNAAASTNGEGTSAGALGSPWLENPRGRVWRRR